MFHSGKVTRVLANAMSRSSIVLKAMIAMPSSGLETVQSLLRLSRSSNSSMKLSRLWVAPEATITHLSGVSGVEACVPVILAATCCTMFSTPGETRLNRASSFSLSSRNFLTRAFLISL